MKIAKIWLVYAYSSLSYGISDFWPYCHKDWKLLFVPFLSPNTCISLQQSLPKLLWHGKQSSNQISFIYDFQSLACCCCNVPHPPEMDEVSFWSYIDSSICWNWFGDIKLFMLQQLEGSNAFQMSRKNKQKIHSGWDSNYLEINFLYCLKIRLDLELLTPHMISDSQNPESFHFKVKSFASFTPYGVIRAWWVNQAQWSNLVTISKDEGCTCWKQRKTYGSDHHSRSNLVLAWWKLSYFYFQNALHA